MSRPEQGSGSSSCFCFGIPGLAAAENHQVTPWKKYYQGEWNEPGIEGRFTPLNIEPLGFLHGDAAYNSHLDQVALVTRMGKRPDTRGAPSTKSSVRLAFSKDGITFTDWQIVHEDRHLHDYPSIVSTGEDNEVLEKSFWVYYKYCFDNVLPDWNWYKNRWDRVLVTLE